MGSLDHVELVDCLLGQVAAGEKPPMDVSHLPEFPRSRHADEVINLGTRHRVVVQRPRERLNIGGLTGGGPRR